MKYSKAEEPLFPAAYFKTVIEPQPASSLESESKPVKQEKPPEDISVLLVGLNGEVEGIVKKVFGEIQVDHVKPGKERTDLHVVRNKIYNKANEQADGYSIVIADVAKVNPIDLNSTVHGQGGQTVAFGAIDRHEKAMLRAHIAENYEQLETELRKLYTKLKY